MARKIDTSDPSKLSEEDRLYLQERGQLPEGAEPVRVSRPTAPALSDVENTGDVNTPKPDPGKVPPPAPTNSGEGDDYDNMSVKELKAEIDRRNEDRDEDAQLSKSGTKKELAASLRADDDGITEE